MELIDSPELPAPAGHYSQAAASGALVFVSGILPARAVVPVPALHFGWLVEVQLVAERTPIA